LTPRRGFSSRTRQHQDQQYDEEDRHEKEDRLSTYGFSFGLSVLIVSEGPISYDASDSHDGSNPNPIFIIVGGCGGDFKKGQLFFARETKIPNVHHNAFLADTVNTSENQRCNPNLASMQHRMDIIRSQSAPTRELSKNGQWRIYV
jgi:hypothetical protein